MGSLKVIGLDVVEKIKVGYVGRKRFK